jgi:hypothetical protein
MPPTPSDPDDKTRADQALARAACWYAELIARGAADDRVQVAWQALLAAADARRALYVV